MSAFLGFLSVAIPNMFMRSIKFIIDHAVETRRPVAQLNLFAAISATDAAAAASAVELTALLKISSI